MKYYTDDPYRLFAGLFRTQIIQSIDDSLVTVMVDNPGACCPMGLKFLQITQTGSNQFLFEVNSRYDINYIENLQDTPRQVSYQYDILRIQQSY